MTWQSRAPAVIDTLVSTWSASPVLAGIVQDGPIPVESADLEVLSVGYDDGDNDGVAVDGLVALEGLCVEPNREQFTVTCLIAVLNGSNDIRAARTRAYELLSAAVSLVLADITLGGIVMESSVQNVTLIQIQNDHGALARLVFTIACDAWTAT